MRSPRRIDKEEDIGQNDLAEREEDKLVVVNSASAANLEPRHKKRAVIPSSL